MADEMGEEEFSLNEVDLAYAFEIWEAGIENARSVNPPVPNDWLVQQGYH